MSVIFDSVSGNDGGGNFASKVPSAYMYHDASASLTTAQVINVPVEVDINAVFTGNLFTNTGDGVITSSSSRPFKANVTYGYSLRNSGALANMRMTIRKNSLATSSGEFALISTIVSQHDDGSITREVDFALTDTIALWAENITNSNDLVLFGLTMKIEFVGWL